MGVRMAFFLKDKFTDCQRALYFNVNSNVYNASTQMDNVLPVYYIRGNYRSYLKVFVFHHPRLIKPSLLYVLKFSFLFGHFHLFLFYYIDSKLLSVTPH